MNAHEKERNEMLSNIDEEKVKALQEQPVKVGDKVSIIKKKEGIVTRISNGKARVETGDTMEIVNLSDLVTEQPICERLEEEMDKFIETFGWGKTKHLAEKELISVTARHFAQWMREKMMKDGLNAVKSGESNMIEKTIAGVFVKYGMDRQREQMMKEAVEGDIGMILHDKTADLCVRSKGYLPKSLGIKCDDKVRIIIVKED